VFMLLFSGEHQWKAITGQAAQRTRRRRPPCRQSYSQHAGPGGQRRKRRQRPSTGDILRAGAGSDRPGLRPLRSDIACCGDITYIPNDEG
jgi:hypothetical protein